MPVYAQSSGSTGPSFEAQTQVLAKLLDQRLSYMKDVAAYKWVNSQPIEDLERERIILEKSLSKAGQYQLDMVSTRSFFELQIELAKGVQEFWFAEWQQNGFAADKFQDLNTEVRPALVLLGDDILQQINQMALWERSAAEVAHMRHLFFQELRTKGVTLREKMCLFDAVIRISKLPDAHTALSR